MRCAKPLYGILFLKAQTKNLEGETPLLLSQLPKMMQRTPLELKLRRPIHLAPAQDLVDKFF